MRDTLRTLALAGAAALLASSAPAAATVDEVVAKHVEARGGAARWKAIESMQITGTMTAWSRKAPFTLHRKRDGKYHLDSIQDGKKVEIGYDGQMAWWENRFMQEGAQKVRGADLPVILREIDFPTPFFDYKEKGYEVKLSDKKTFEGRPAIALEVKRSDGLSETWYLDPRTYLEIARESPGADFGRPVPLTTIYDDFRTVAGVKVPHYVESQWYTRERVLDVEKVETNVTLDDALFRLPPPTGMAPVQPMAGEWKVTFTRRNSEQEPWRDGERETRIDNLLGGALIQEAYTTSEGREVVRTITYDRYRKVYRVTEVNDSSTYMDLLDGDFDDQKRLVLTNVKSGTTLNIFGLTIYSRVIFSEIAADSFKMEEEYSIDEGKTWVPVLKATFTRKAG